MLKFSKIFLVFLIFLFISEWGYSQHFGRNKVVYDKLDFRIYETPNFLIYHYLEDEMEIELFAQMCER